MAGPATLFQSGVHSSRPASGAGCVLYNCTEHNLVYVDNGSSWSTYITLASGIADTTFNAKGDILSASADDTPAILSVGANGSVLRAASGQTTGLEWQKNNLAATAAPGASDDNTAGYSVGSAWFDTTNDEVYFAIDVSTGAAVWKQVGSGGSGSFDPDVHMPRHIPLLPTLNSPSASTGTWVNVNQGAPSTIVGPFVYATAIAHYNSSNAQNDDISYEIPLSAGTWDCRIFVRKFNNGGIITLLMDAASQGTMDTYSASDSFTTVSVTGFTVATTGLKTMTFRMATKNASSGGYYGVMFGIEFHRTA